MDKIKVQFDGACWNEGKPPIMGIGVAVFIDNDLAEEHCISRCTGVGTNNIAEYDALIAALNWVYEYVTRETGVEAIVHVLGDSMLIVNQVNGDWGVKVPHLKPKYAEARELMEKLRGVKGVSVKLQWIRREFNKDADKLSKQAIQPLIH